QTALTARGEITLAVTEEVDAMGDGDLETWLLRKVYPRGVPHEIYAATRDALRFDADVLAEAVVELLKTRDFLGLHLHLAHGGMTDEEFDERSAPYFLDPEPQRIDELAAKLRVLMDRVDDPDRLDGGTVMLL